MRHGVKTHPHRCELRLAHGRNCGDGPEGAVDIVYKRELEKAANKIGMRAEKIEEFRERFANPYVAADRGFVDAVIQPRETRKKLIQALEMLQNKRDKNPPKKHGNIPL